MRPSLMSPQRLYFVTSLYILTLTVAGPALLAQVSSPLRVDQTTYRASCTQGKGEGCTYGFTLIARYENPTTDTLYLGRCTPEDRTPVYGIMVASDSTEDAAYNPVWACVGHDYPIVIAPHRTRVDTLKIEEHNVAELVGDSVRYSRRAVVDTMSQNLGTVMLALPHAP